MKQKFTLLFFLAITCKGLFAQVPQGIPYQSIIRNSAGNVAANQTVKLRFSIHDSITSGTVVYQETFSTTTSSLGLANVNIGMGTAVVGTFSGINWGKNSKFMQVEMDPSGGTNYTDMGTTQMMSVPYALFCANGTPGPQGPAGAAGTNAGVGGFTHYLGEAFNGGIIYYLYKGSDGLEHGLIVALTESTSLAWQTSPTLVNANLTEDGAYNTNLMTNSPAKTYIQSLGAGWYLPSIDELGLLYFNRYSAQKGLRAGSHTLLSNTGVYWSSTEYNAPYAYFFLFTNGYANNFNKTNTFTVRGVRAF